MSDPVSSFLVICGGNILVMKIQGTKVWRASKMQLMRSVRLLRFLRTRGRSLARIGLIVVIAGLTLGCDGIVKSSKKSTERVVGEDDFCDPSVSSGHEIECLNRLNAQVERGRRAARVLGPRRVWDEKIDKLTVGYLRIFAISDQSGWFMLASVLSNSCDPLDRQEAVLYFDRIIASVEAQKALNRDKDWLTQARLDAQRSISLGLANCTDYSKVLYPAESIVAQPKK